jgi:hypothetical protein
MVVPDYIGEPCCDDDTKLGPDPQQSLLTATTLSCTPSRLDISVYQFVVSPTHLALTFSRLSTDRGAASPNWTCDLPHTIHANKDVEFIQRVRRTRRSAADASGA